MKKLLVSTLLFASLLAVSYANNDVEKQKRLQQGKVLYSQVCMKCHDIGFDGAPRLGNYNDWQEIQKYGKEALFESVVNGKGMMPPRGRSADESAEHYMLMLEYMLSTVGAENIKTTPEMQAKAERDRHIKNGEVLYNMVCANCHQEGKLGAPKIGDKAAWASRTAKGYDALVSNVIEDHGGMVRVGGSAIQSLEGVREMVAYMLTTVDYGAK